MAATKVADLDGLFKKIYAPKLENLIPESAIIVKSIPFTQKDKQNGASYNQPVILTQEQGITQAASDAGAFDLNDSIPMTTKNALVIGSQILLRSSMSYEAAAKASTTTKAFVDATQLMIQNMLESITKRVEVLSLYGGSGLAKCQTSANVDANNTVIAISAQSWAIGIWSGSENLEIDIFNVSSQVGGTTPLKITKVDFENKKITVNSATAADITSIDTIIAANAGVLDIFYRGGFNTEMAGINKIITNTGTLFGIDASVFSLWKGNTSDVGAADLTVDKVVKAMNIPVGLGLMEAAELHCSPRTWHGLATEITGNRVYDDSYSTKDNANGTQSITYYAQNGKITVISNPCVKEGDSFVFPLSRMKRLGAQDISFKTPGRTGDIFRELSDKAGFELRCYTDQAMFIETPARCLKFFNITNT